MRSQRFTWLAASGLLLALFAFPAFGQTTGDMVGTVVDSSGGPLSGVRVEISSGALQGSRWAKTNASGAFRFFLLPPGSYTLTATLAGFALGERKGVVIGLGDTVTVPVTLTVATVAEVDVAGEVPLVDLASTKIGTSMPAGLLTKLPLGRNFSSAMLTVGGTGTDGQGYTVYGATGLENNYIVDGLNTTGVLQGTQGKQLNMEFVQEVEVRTGGYEAEYGRAMGASVNVVTKSGGNDFHGGVFGYYDSGSLTASDKHAADRAVLNQSLPADPTRYDMGLDLGGYFLKDRLWFFGAYDRVRNDQDYERVESLTYTPTSIVSNYVPGTDVKTTSIFSTKLTFRAGEAHTFVASVFGDPDTSDGRFGTNVIGPASAVLGRVNQGGTDVVARWEGLFGTRFLGQAQYGYHSEEDEWLSDYGDRPLFYDIRRGFGQAAPGSGPGVMGPGTLRRNAWGATGTAFLGSHELKGGIGYELLNSSYADVYTGGGEVFRWRASDTGAFQYARHDGLAKVPMNCQVRTDGSRGNFGYVDPTTCNGWEAVGGAYSNPTTKNLSLFLQDSWKVLSNLTVNAGVRYEEQRLYDAGGDARIKLTGQWSPRVGVVWDPAGNGRSKVFASYGRFYQVIPQGIQVAALGNEIYQSAYNYTEDRVDLVTDPALAPYTYLAGSDYVPPGIKGIYQDEIVAGVELEFARNWSVGLKGIYRALGRALEDRCDVFDPRSGLASLMPPGNFTSCVMMNPGEGTFGQLSDPANPDCWQDYPASTVPKPCDSVRPSRVFRGLQLDVRRRFSDRFQVQASYLYSKLTGNYDGFVNERTGQALPGLNTDFDIPERLINVSGRLSLDRTHQVKLSGFYVFPFGLQAGLVAAFATGAPLSIMGWAPSGYLQYLEPRGSWDQLPSTYNVDIHVEYPFRLGPVTATPLLDVFNVTDVQTATQRGQTYNNVKGASQSPPYDSPTVASFGKDTAWQKPRVIRIGARISF